MIAKNNTQGVWGFTYRSNKFCIGKHTALPFDKGQETGKFHCFFTRKAARQYKRFLDGWRYTSKQLKIIKVYASRENIVNAGVEEGNSIPAISVSKMEIKSLKHQR